MAGEIDTYVSSWRDELNSAALYRALAAAESSDQLAEVYRRLADVEERHAGFWADKVRAAGAEVPTFRVGWRTKVLASLAKRFGPSFVVPTIDAMEQADSASYDDDPAAAHTPMPSEERSHARVLQHISRRGGGLEGSAVARLEGRHRSASANSLRASVLGANDGLLSNFSLVMGVAGADLSGNGILIAGFAGLLAGAGSMAMGEWISVQSSRELYERQIGIERQELAERPEEEREELALIYMAKGLPEAEARALADRLMSDPTTALDTLAREELAVDPDDLGGSAMGAAVSSFLLFAMGAILPVIPFMFLEGFAAIVTSAAISAAGLFGIGAAITLFTGRSAWVSGGRQLAIGAAAAALTYGVGLLLGVAVGG
ncbi:MAG TPA: VIT1/CCC1 transporter family protein [Actinomycetota bacterium]|nr:VIT1/CCC1 transporter family protein [Actinomycetota bacterium]